MMADLPGLSFRVRSMTPAMSIRTRLGHFQLWHLYALVSAVAILTYVVLPKGSASQAAVFMAAEVVVMVVLGATALRATKVSDRAVWALLALGQAVSLAGNV